MGVHLVFVRLGQKAGAPRDFLMNSSLMKSMNITHENGM